MVDGQMNPSERALRARLAAHAMHGRHDARQTTAKARATFLASFERQADPDGRLPPAERPPPPPPAAQAPPRPPPSQGRGGIPVRRRAERVLPTRPALNCTPRGSYPE